MIIVPFKAEHMKQIVEQDATACLSAHLTFAHILAMEQSPWSFTGVADGKVVGCAGVVEHWPGRGEAWAALDQGCGRHMTAITRAVRRFFDACPMPRVEIIVGASFDAGHRWAKMLGFERQSCEMAGYLPTGEAAVMYARVR